MTIAATAQMLSWIIHIGNDNKHEIRIINLSWKDSDHPIPTKKHHGSVTSPHTMNEFETWSFSLRLLNNKTIREP